MKEKILEGFRFLLSLSVAVLILYFTYKIILSSFLAFASLQENTAKILVTALIAVTTTVLGIVVGKYYEKRMAIEQENRKYKIEVYKKFVEFFFDFMNDSKIGKTDSEKTQSFLKNFNKDIVVWSSDEVLSSYAKYKMDSAKSIGASDKFNLKLTSKNIARIFLAMRKDIGYSNKNIHEKEILGLFINDVEEIFK